MSNIKDKLHLLPQNPGVYKMLDKFGNVIYVGKAKVLKNRVSSYFHGAHNKKTTLLVSEIDDFEYILTDSDKEAYILEINLIKKYNPKYNIMLKGDNYYPYICITREKNPRIILVRHPEKAKNIAQYFGPYPNSSSARKTLKLLNYIYPLRKCHNMPNKVCLYYHIGQCLAPCVAETQIDFKPYVDGIRRFLNGDTKDVLETLEQKMKTAAKNMQYELAAEYRDLLKDVENTTQSQKINLNDFTSRDIFGFYHDVDNISITILYMRQGQIVQNYNTIIPYALDVNEELENFITNFYDQAKFKPTEILLPESIDFSASLEEYIDIKVLTPKKGKKKDLISMAEENAKHDLETKLTLHKNKVLRNTNTINKLGQLLNIAPPRYIESFDNSNLFGEYPVSGMVVFRDGAPSPKEYRKFKVKTVTGPNDYGTMKEIIYRRYLALKMEDKPFPDLIVMDGGQIQVNAALEVLDSINVNIPVCGVKKDKTHKAQVLVFDNKEILLNRNSDEFLFISNISETVHKYAISYFRSKKSKGLFSSKLEDIEGLGPKGREKLLKKFITLDKIKAASFDELKSAGINKVAAQNIIEYFKGND